jgi:hypothetical protein
MSKTVDNPDMGTDTKSARDHFIGKKLVAYSKMQVDKGEESWVLVFEDGNAIRTELFEPVGIDSLKEIIAKTRDNHAKRIDKATGRIADLDYVNETLIKLRGIR